MEVHELIEELKLYDFKRILSFHRKTGISPKTIKKYLTQYNIPHNTKNVKHPGSRDSLGRFCLNYAPNFHNDSCETRKVNEDEHDSNKMKKLVDITKKFQKITGRTNCLY